MSDVPNLAARLERASDRPALVVGERSLTYRVVAERLALWRGGLIQAGVRSGDRVAILAPSNESFVLAHLAAMGIGAMSVPLNPQSPPAELSRELSAVDPFVAVVDPSAYAVLAAALSEAVNLEVRTLTVDELDRADPYTLVDVEADTPAALLFTSGTAGRPKPAMLTHGNLTAALQSVLSLPTDLVGTEQTFVAPVPLFHVFGLNVVLHLGLLIGGTVVLGEFESSARTIELIERHRVTVVAGPPTLWRAFSRTDGAGPDAFSSVTLALSGAAKLPPGLKIEVGERLGVELEEGYGLTETSAVVASTIGTEAPLGSVGRLLPGVEARIVDAFEQDCLVGDAGELLVRGPMVFSGYWGGLDGGRSPLDDDDGWLRTGDVAVVDEDGHIAIVDRTKDLVIVSGFNVFPAEVELVLQAHPKVAEAGIVGEPSESTGESIVAFVVPEEGTDLDEDELRRHCLNELARYKVPSRFVIAPNLPIGPTGKLQRNRLT